MRGVAAEAAVVVPDRPTAVPSTSAENNAKNSSRSNQTVAGAETTN